MSADFRNWRTKQKDRAFARNSRRGKAAWREGGTLRTRMAERGCPDAETARQRALYDARGDFSGRHTFPAPNGVQDVWETRRSVSGRTDQHEVYVEGVLCATIGAKLLGLLMAERYRRGPMSAQDVKAWADKAQGRVE